ncbi:MAG: alpha/beta fold hydrolase [Rhodospirillales bacterium]
MLFKEEIATYHWEKRFFSLPQYREINDQETATESGEPYLLIPEKPNCLGVVLVHGFLASPAELRAFGEQLYTAGYPVIGVRLKGHGTSPWDLRGRRWQDWLESVRQGYRIISAFSEQVCLVGFSTGGTLSLLLAAEHPPRLAGVVAVSAPIRFRNRNLVFVPLMRGANRLVQLVSKSQGLMLFHPNESEHPHVNYKNIPIRGLHELRRIVDELKDCLGDVKCPVCLVQGSDDQVVDPISASLIRDDLGSDEVDFYMVNSNRHGILNEDIGKTREHVRSFLDSTVESLKKTRTAYQIVIGQHHRLAAARQDFPWLRAYPKDVDWFKPVSERRVTRYLDKAVARYGDHPCIDFLGRKYTYEEVGDLVNKAAKGFQNLGVGKGVRVGLCLPNTPYFVICYYAILKSGGTVVNYNPLYADRELVHQVEDSETHFMVTLNIGQIYNKVLPLLERTRLQTIVVCPMREILPMVKGLMYSVFKRSEVATIPDDSRHVLFSDLIDNDGYVEDLALDLQHDIAVLQYTGGTTGLPKGAMLTHANVSANTEQVYRWFPGMKKGRERILVVLPLFHVFAMTAAMNLGIAGGAELILLPRFDLEQVLKTIDADKPSLFPGVPTLFAAINNFPELDDYDLSSIKFCISGGAPLSPDVRTRFEDQTGCNLVEGYGLSEASPVVACSPAGGLSMEGSVGIPLPGTVIEICDRNLPKKQLLPGEIGEICVRGPQVMKGYWGKPKETAATIIDDRLHTGDLGYMDEDGYIFLIDRIKDLILYNGYNIYPRVVEEAISLHPAVDEVTVVGVPDDYHGQYPKAFIKLRSGEALSSEALIKFLEDKLSPMERPREVEFRDELPKSLIGKLSKKELVSEQIEKSSAEQA